MSNFIKRFKEEPPILEILLLLAILLMLIFNK